MKAATNPIQASSLVSVARASGMDHLTLNTGHKRVTLASEVEPEVVQMLMPLVVGANGQPVPMPTAEATHTISIETDGTSMRASIHPTQRGFSMPVVTFAVCLVPDAGHKLWAELHRPMPTATRFSGAPKRPWIAVRLELYLELQAPEFIDLLGDFERCLAWTFVEYVSSSN